MLIQTVLFANKDFTIKKARSWLKKHGLKSKGKVDETTNYLRFRQMTPQKGWKYFTKNLAEGIRVVLTYPGLK